MRYLIEIELDDNFTYWLDTDPEQTIKELFVPSSDVKIISFNEIEEDKKCG